MGFYNVQKGDAPYMKELADEYTLSHNFHQFVMDSTGANHIMFGFADAICYSDGNGNALTPPNNSQYSRFTIPPVSVPHIGNVLNKN